MQRRSTGPFFAATIAALILLFAGSAPAQTLTNGIDISNFQPTVNWTSVKNAGIPFAFTKATEGVNFVDASFTSHMAGAIAAGVYIGPYHFGRINSNIASPTDAVDEANDFVDAIQSYYVTPSYVLRPVLDVENLPYADTTANRAANKAYVSQWVRDFAGVVQSRLGFAPILYMNTNYATTFCEANLSQYPLWLANYNYTPPTLPPASADGIFNGWDFWQYTDTGTVAGISGNVDRDVFQGTLAQLVTKYQGVAPNGDFNGDHSTDGADLLAWSRNLGKTGTATHAQGDAEGDRDVDATDLATWTGKFATSTAASAPALGSVPEPAAISLALCGVMLLACRRRI